jgi:hypothetical protein
MAAYRMFPPIGPDRADELAAGDTSVGFRPSRWVAVVRPWRILCVLDTPGKRNAPGATAQGTNKLDSLMTRVHRNSVQTV